MGNQKWELLPIVLRVIVLPYLSRKRHFCIKLDLFIIINLRRKIDMAGEEVGTKLLRLLYFVGAGVICTKGINLWRDYGRKAAIKAAAATAAEEEAAQNPSELVTGAAGPK